jgi:hypothetical protein
MSGFKQVVDATKLAVVPKDAEVLLETRLGSPTSLVPYHSLLRGAMGLQSGAIVGDRRSSNLAALMTYQPIFPAAILPAALTLLRVLPIVELAPALQGFKVRVQGELLSAPYRVYYQLSDLRSAITNSTGETRSLALCLGTRHWDGFVREECLRQIIAIDQPWAAPFVIQLLGEYVIEIVEVIAAAIPAMDAGRFSEFVLENPEFMATTRRRATSYWDCYYRRHFPKLQTYPAITALDAIEQMARSD